MKARLAFAALMLPLLSGGCVAALVPLAAAGGLVKTQSGGKDKADANPVAAPTFVAAAPSPPEEPAEMTAGTPVAELPPSSAAYEVLDLTELPPPSGAARAAAISAYNYTPFTEFVTKQKTVDPSRERRLSAILKDPSRLNGEVEPCYGQPPAVLIDIDPEGEIFDTTDPGTLDPGLKTALQQLADQSVEVLWISDLSPNFSGEVTAALQRAGISSVREESLLLGAGEERRKQVLRERAASRFCIVAIAGDEKGDFDEAYFYLRDPGAAIGLEKLYDNGWFLTPAPFLQDKTDKAN